MAKTYKNGDREYTIGSHKVTFRPVFDFVVTPMQIQQESRKVYSGGLVAGTMSPRKGLTEAEEKKYLPAIISISSSDPQFTTAANNFWHEFRKTIPYEGIELEIGVTDAGVPLDINQYILYNLTLTDNKVAISEEDHEQIEIFDFVIIDPKKREAKEREISDKRINAMVQLTKLVADESTTEKLRAIITLNSVSLQVDLTKVNAMSRQDLIFYAQKVMEQSPDKFAQHAANADVVTYIAKVRNFIFYKLLEKIDRAIYLNGRNIGKDEQSAAKYLMLDETGKQYYLELDGLLQEKLK